MDIIVHYDEIGTKLGNRSFFEKRLVENIKSKIECRISRLAGRIILNTNDSKFREKLERTPGVANFSACKITPSNINSIKKAALELVKSRKGTFKVSAQRSDKTFPLTSMEVNALVGEYILKHSNLKVNVKKPRILIYIEITKDNTFIYIDKVKGIGGLPVGTAGKVISLLSGGFDSPVASYLMMKRGAEVVLVHFFNNTTRAQSVLVKLNKLCEKLSEYQNPIKLIIIHFGEAQREIIEKIPAKYRILIYKRLMFKICDKIKDKVLAFVTGDSLSQVSSQTLENIAAVRSSTQTQILSPLIGMNKQEILELAKKIGTYEFSAIPYDDCCSLLVAKHPVIKSDEKKLIQLEKGLNTKSVIRNCLKDAEIKIFKLV